jgi:uncharacterized protein
VPIVAVFDTNVLLSAVGWKGKPFECVELACTGRIQAFTCPELLDELTSKLQSKLRFTNDQAADTILDFLSFLRVIAITGTVKVVSADPDDDKVLECALVASATHIVTGDRRHLLPIGSFHGARIVSAADFMIEVNAGI